MKKAFLLIFFIFFFPVLLFAQQKGVKLINTGESLISTEPGKSITIVLNVTNTGGSNEEFVMDADIPESWRMISRFFPFQLPSGASDMKIVSIFIPQDAAADKYELKFTVKSTRNPGIIDICTVYVAVQSITKLEVNLIDAPRFCVAGNEYISTFRVTNNSNSAQEITLKLSSSNNIPASIDINQVKLSPRDAVEVPVLVKVPENLKQDLIHIVKLSAVGVENGKPVEAFAESRVQIIVKGGARESRLITVPARMSLRALGAEEGDESAYAWQGELSGQNTFGTKDNITTVEYSFRGPDTYDDDRKVNLIYTSHDEYWMKLGRKHYGLLAGDTNYSLTELTENAFYARGVQANANYGKFSLMGYYAKSRFTEPEEIESAASIDYSLTKDIILGLNFMHHNPENKPSNSLGSIDLNISTIGRTNIDLEYSIDKGDDGYANGYYGNISTYNDFFNGNLKFLRAEPGFDGTYNDQQTISGSVNVPIKKLVTVNASIYNSRTNLENNENKYSASLQYTYQAGLTFNFKTNTTLYTGLKLVENKDQLDAPLFDYRQKTLNASISQTLKRFVFSLSTEIGRERDYLYENDSEVDRLYFSGAYKPLSGHTFGVYANIDNNRNDQGRKHYGTTLGFNMDYVFNPRNNIGFSLEGRKLEVEGSGTSYVYNSNLNITIAKIHTIFLETRYVPVSSNDDDSLFAFSLKYSFLIGIPVGIRTDFGSIVGKVIDAQTGRGLQGVIVVLGKMTTITDKNGNFEFYTVKNGDAWLDIDASNISAGLITTVKPPIKVSVSAGKNRCEISLVKASRITGKLLLYEFEKTQLSETDKAGLIEIGGLSGVVLELKNENSSVSAQSTRDGTFSFDDLLPGKWTLTINKNSLPRFTYLEKNDLEFELKPGDAQDITIKVLPRKRVIQMLGGGAVQMENQ